jgi:hypothetical protein
MDSTSLNQVYRLMALCARVGRHSRFDEQLARQLRDFTAWEALPAQAELHGMGPLLWHHLQGADIPESARRTLRGLYLRDRALNQVHAKTLLELLDLLGQGGIRPLVLKGLALAWQAYPDPALRPVSDTDLFLAKDDLLPAIDILQKGGYRFNFLPTQLNRLPKGLNADSPSRDGVSTHIELHHYDPAHRAINDNSPDDEFRDICEPPQRLTIDGCDVYTTSPIDTLHYLMRHFTRHLSDARADRPVSFKWMADITSLVEKQAHALDWKALLERDPAFLKRLSVLYSLTPLPEGYENFLPLKKPVSMDGLGQYPRGWPQWPFPNWVQVGFWRYVRLTFAPPPEWWLRLVYGLDSGPVAWHGQVVYRLRLLQLMGWALVRRLPFIRRRL